jgi:hypothetical protein
MFKKEGKHEKNDYCEYRLKDCQDLLETLQPLVDENCFLTGQSFISAYYFCQALKIQVLSLPLAIHTPDANEKNEKIQVIYQNMLHDLNMFKNNQLTEIKVKHVLFSNNEQKIKDYFEKNCTIDWLGGYLSMKRFVNIRNSQRTKNSILSFIIKIDMKKHDWIPNSNINIINDMTNNDKKLNILCDFSYSRLDKKNVSKNETNIFKYNRWYQMKPNTTNGTM